MAFAVDLGNFYYTQRQLQTLADAAAMAGAQEVDTCINAGTTKCGAMTTAANYAFTTENNAPAGVTLTINNGPSALGAADPNNGDKHYVEAVVSENVPTYFARIFGNTTVLVKARAEAGKAIPPVGGPCLNTNNLTLNSGASITDAVGSNCGINDNATGGLSTNAAVTVAVSSFTYAGSSYNKNCGSCTTYSPLPTTSSPTVADPYASLAVPAQPANSSSNVGTISSGANTNGCSGYTLCPGTYTSGLSFNSGSGAYTVTLSPGLYYFTNGFNADTNVTIKGDGVTLFFAGGSVNMNTSATFILTAPTTALSNCASCAGMVIWEPSGDLNLDASSSSSWGGAVYLKTGQLTLNGGSTATAYSNIFAYSVMVNSAISLGGSSGGAANGSTTIALAE